MRALLPPKSSLSKRPHTVDFAQVAQHLHAALDQCPSRVRAWLVQCLHMALMRTTHWDPARFVNTHLFEPQCLQEVFQLFAYTTLHKRVAAIGPFGSLYRKAFPAKRQPRHWKTALKRAWASRVTRVHLTELGAWHVAGFLGPTHYSLAEHERWANAYYHRMDETQFVDVLDFYLDSPKESLAVTARFFERLNRPFAAQWQQLSPQWPHYVQELYSFTDIDAFNSQMADLGPKCLVPLTFWETVFQGVGFEPCDASLVRDPRLMSFVLAPPLLKSTKLNQDAIASLRFLRLFGDECTVRELRPVILAFYRERMGPSVLKSILLKRLAPKTQIKRLAWLWFAAFGSHWVSWPSNLERSARNAVQQRWDALRVRRHERFLERRLQLCLNCGRVHTVHNQPVSAKPNVCTTVFDASRTLGVVGASYDVLQDRSYCGRQNSQIAKGCKQTEAVCFNVRGWTYHHYTCYFVCTHCGIIAVWDPSTCKFPQAGPLCSLCSLAPSKPLVK